MPHPDISDVVVVFDMDGVLAEYTHSDYDDGSWLKPNYFATRPACSRAFELLSFIMNVGCSVYVCSTLPSDYPHYDHAVSCKKRWLIDQLHARNIPAAKVPALIVPDSRKAEAVSNALGQPLDTNVVLIDDRALMCQQFRNAGGSAIQYANGVNTPEHMSPDHTAFDYFVHLTSLVGETPLSLICDKCS